MGDLAVPRRKLEADRHQHGQPGARLRPAARHRLRRRRHLQRVGRPDPAARPLSRRHESPERRRAVNGGGVRRGREARRAAPRRWPTVMTVAVFLFSLLGAMALGMPIAYALILCGVALMIHLGTFDSQIVAQNIINGADSFPLLAVPFFMLAGELMNTGGLSKRIVNLALSMVG